MHGPLLNYVRYLCKHVTLRVQIFVMKISVHSCVLSVALLFQMKRRLFRVQHEVSQESHIKSGTALKFKYFWPIFWEIIESKNGDFSPVISVTIKK